MASLFEQDIGKLKGVGNKRRALFKRLGANSIGELLYIYPKSYEDWSFQTNIESTRVNEVFCIKGRVTTPVVKNVISPKMCIYKFNICDNTGTITITFFNTKYIINQFKIGEEFLFYGKIKIGYTKKEMISPSFVPASYIPNIRPIYHKIEGLTSKQIENAQKNALLMLPDEIYDPIPEYIRKKYTLCGLKFALENAHFPTDNSALEKARRRIIFEELLVLQMGINKIKTSNSIQNKFKIKKDFSEEFWNLLAFSPTSAQKRILSECVKDMQSDLTMRRLIQGDVGSGKTAIAAGICYNVIKSGAQAAFMVPTEILAEQHYNSLKKMFEKTDIKIELLTGSTKKSKKRLIKDCIESGVTDLIIGTHALISNDVYYKNLGLVITDEQHRFGVSQRSKLAAKGQNPHVIVMSATPIPRTLALIIYGDMDVSIVDEMPSGRQNIDTFFIDENKRERAFNFIKSLIDQGRQAYIICPLVDESDSKLFSAVKYYEKIQKEQFKNYKVGLLHGKMNNYDKTIVMENFINKKIDILVSTTVIEVGVDVPNAAVMLIENAEMFGLSQLHQLRGRVGRGNFKSYCILISNTSNEYTKKRLKTISQIHDGIKIADEDLKVRGPGEFFGTKQHGLPVLKNASLLKNLDILEQTKKAAAEILENDPELALQTHKYLKGEINRLFSSTLNGFSF